MSVTQKSSLLKNEIDELNRISQNIENAFDLRFDESIEQQDNIESNEKCDKVKSEEHDL